MLKSETPDTVEALIAVALSVKPCPSRISAKVVLVVIHLLFKRRQPEQSGDFDGPPLPKLSGQKNRRPSIFTSPVWGRAVQRKCTALSGAGTVSIRGCRVPLLCLLEVGIASTLLTSPAISTLAHSPWLTPGARSPPKTPSFPFGATDVAKSLPPAVLPCERA